MALNERCDMIVDFIIKRYAVVDVLQFDPKFELFIKPEFGHHLTKYGEMIKVATREQHLVEHPVLDGYAGPDILVFREHNKNAVIMSVNELKWDRYCFMDGSNLSSGIMVLGVTMTHRLLRHRLLRRKRLGHAHLHWTSASICFSSILKVGALTGCCQLTAASRH